MKPEDMLTRGEKSPAKLRQAITVLVEERDEARAEVERLTRERDPLTLLNSFPEASRAAEARGARWMKGRVRAALKREVALYAESANRCDAVDNALGANNDRHSAMTFRQALKVLDALPEREEPEALDDENLRTWEEERSKTEREGGT
jgi:hypothetical protein